MAQQLYRAIRGATTPTVTLTQDADAVNTGQDIQILDIDMSGGSVNVNLPSLTSTFFGATSTGGGVGVGSTMYKIQFTINAGAFPNILTFNAFNTGGDTDTICGSASVTVTGVGATGIIFIGARHTWGILVCNTGTIS